MSSLFVTATGTDIGKTFVSCALIRHWRAKGLAVAGFKPILSGFDPLSPDASDAGALLSALGAPVTQQGLDLISPWRFAAPLSPDMAARREGRAIPFDKLLAACRALMLAMPKDGRLVIEGVGGIMVPFDAHRTVLDLMAELRAPVLLVAGSYLGTLSHTLSALSALKTRAIVPVAVLINETESSPVPLAETVASLRPHAPGIPILTLSRNPDAAALAAMAGAIDDRIAAQ
jgi:dethiobiotin synthetase